MSTSLPIIAKRLHDLRKENNLTQEKLAESIETTTKTYREWEKKGIIPTTDFLIKLSEKFNVSTDYLLGKSDCRTIDENIKMIVEATRLSEKAIEKLLIYDPCILKILDTLICTKTEYKSLDNTGLFEALLYQMWVYSYRMESDKMEIHTDNTKPQLITDKAQRRIFFKQLPTKIFDLCLEIAEQIRKEGD